MAKYQIAFTQEFKRDYKKIQRRRLKVAKLKMVVELLANDEILPERLRDHALAGKWNGARECHIAPDWLLIYMKTDERLVLTLMRTGTHSDLF